MTLQYRPSDGKLLHHPSDGDSPDQLMNECCCDDGGETGGSGCKSCDPQMENVYTITLSGLSGDFAAYNGATLVYCCKGIAPYESGCVWMNEFLEPDTKPWLLLGAIDGAGGSRRWFINLDLGGSCKITWNLEFTTTDEPWCDNHPDAGTYSAYSCSDSTCDDTESCDDSVGATCVVS